MKRSLYILLSILFSISTLFAQSTYEVRGCIAEKEGEQLAGAVVIFRAASDSLATFPTVTDGEGCFKQLLPSSKYTYFISYGGKEYRSKSYHLTVTNQLVDIGRIVIDVKDLQLDEVVVSGTRPFVSYNGANPIYNLSANPDIKGSNLLDGLKLLPGIYQKNDMGLTAFGIYDVTIALNGRVLLIPKEEVHAYLATFNVDDVESVELIRNPGPEYGSNVDVVLNITTKKKSWRNESNLFMSSDASTQQGSLFSEALRGRFNLNQGISRNYISASISNTHRMETLETTLGNDTTKVAPRRLYSVETGSDLQLSERSLLGGRIGFSKIAESLLNNHTSQVDLDRNTVTATLYHHFNREGLAWDINGDMLYSKSKTLYQILQNEQNSEHDNRTQSYRVTSNVSYRLSSSTKVQSGIISSHTLLDDQYQGNKLRLSYREHRSSIYATLYYHHKSINGRGGVQVNNDIRVLSDISTQYKSDSQKWSLWNIQPYFNIDYSIAKNHLLSFSLSSYYNRPLFRDLLPYTSGSSGFLKRNGNPDLKNSFRYNLSLTYSFMRAATLELSYSDEKLPIVETISQKGNSYYLSRNNLDRSRYFRVVAGIPIPIIYNSEVGINWIASTYFAFHRQFDTGVINATPLDKVFNAYYLMHSQSLSLPQNWNILAQATYYSPIFLGVYQTTKPQWWIDLTVSKRIANRKFALSGRDLLNSNVAEGQVIGLPIEMRFKKNWHQPTIMLSATLFVGNDKLKKTRQMRASDSADRIVSTADESISLQKK